VDGRLVDAAQLRVREVDRRLRPLVESERGRPLVGAEAEQRAQRDDAAAPGLPARDSLELTQLLQRVDANVGVAADAHPDRAVAHAGNRQEAVAEDRFWRRAHAEAR